MGVLSKPLGEGPPRDDWIFISTRIAAGFEESRKQFFDACITIFEQAITAGHKPRTQIVCRVLGGEAELAIKAYQFLLASECIGSYIPSPQANEFAMLLYAQVCGIKTQETYFYFKRYDESRTTSYQHSRFASDVAGYIIGGEANYQDQGDLAILIPRFNLITNMLIATAFGDQSRLRELESLEPTIRKYEQGDLPSQDCNSQDMRRDQV